LGAHVHELVANDRMLSVFMEPLLLAREQLAAETMRLHRQLVQVVHEEPVCRRLITMPGIGPVTALTFRATINDPSPLPTIPVCRGVSRAHTAPISVG
jgi:transposase